MNQDLFEGKYIPEPNSGCWIWTACVDIGGYGRFGVDGSNRKAHRVSWELYRHPIPDGLCALHRCDNRLCVNPDHLFLGTHADNAADRDAKGRLGDRAGSANNRTNLTDDDVRAIRSDNRKLKEIAPDYGLQIAAVSKIKTGRSWRTVQ